VLIACAAAAATGKWREVRSTGMVPAPRKCFAFAHVRDRLFVFGGLGASR